MGGTISRDELEGWMAEQELRAREALERRINQLERQCAALAAEIDAQRQREQALSGAYLRLRRLIGREAFDTPHGPSGERVWTTTEAALGKLVAEIDRMRPVVEATIKEVNRDNDRFSWSDLKDAVDAYEAAKERG